MDEKLKQLYDKLTQDGYELPDFSTFTQKMRNRQDAEKLYSTLSTDGYELPASFDEFYKTILPPSPAEVNQVNTSAFSSPEVEEAFRQGTTSNVVDDYIGAGISGINRGVSQGVSSTLKFLGALNQVGTPEFSSPEVAEAYKQGTTNYALGAGQAVEDFTNNINPVYENVNQTYQNVAQGVGQAGAMLAFGAPPVAQVESAVAGLSPRVAKVLGAVGRTVVSGAGVVGGAMTAVPEWEAAKKAGLSDEDAFQTLIKNYLVGQTEAIPLERLMVGLNKITGGKMIQAVKLMGEQAITEGLQEGIQTYLTNEIAKSDYDPDRDPLFQVIESAKVGGIVGMILPMVGSIPNLTAEKKVKIERKLGEVEADQAISELSVDPQTDAELDAEAQIDPVDKQILEEVKVADAIQEEQNDKEDEERLSSEVREREESLEGKPEQETSSKKTETGGVFQKEEISNTPEYKLAVKRIEDLQKKFSELDISENADELLFDLREARQALQKIVGRPASKTSEIKTRINETTGVSKADKSVQLTPQQALAAQIRIQDRGIKIGRDLTQENVVSRIKEAAEEAKLSPKQVQAIARRGEKVTLTPKSIESFNKFVSKVVEDADYADKLSQARTYRKKIRSKKKSDNRSFREKAAMSQFAKINPTQVTDINEYNELASQLDKPFNLAEVTTKTRELVGKIYQDELQVSPPEGHTTEQMMADLQAKREADRDTDRLQKIADDLGITIDEARTLDESEDQTDSRKERLRQSYIEIAKTKKPEPEIEVDKLQAKDISDINKIDPSLLTTDELKDYIRVVDRINENGDFSMSGRLASKGLAQEGWRELKKREMKTLNLTQVEALMDSQPMAIEAILGLPEDAAMFQLYSGIKGMNDSGALGKREAETAADFLTNLKKKYPEAFKDESLFRQGMYQELIRTPESMEPDEALRINKQLIQSSIDKQRTAGFDKEADIDAKFFKPFATAKTMDQVYEIMGKIDSQGKTVVDELIKYHENHTLAETDQTILDLITSDNERFENKDTERVLNFAGPRKWKQIGPKAVTEQDDIIAFNPEFARAPKPKQIKSGMSLTMRDREGAILDFNLHKNSIDNIEKSVLRAFAKPHQYQIRDFLKQDADLQKLLGAGATPESIRRARNMTNSLFDEKKGIFFNFERDLMNNSRAYPNEFVKNFATFMNGMKKIGYSTTLSGYTQAPKQATVLVNVARQLGDNAGFIADSVREKDQPGYDKFFRGQTVDIRGEQSAILNVGRFYSASERLEAQSKLNRYFNQVFPLNSEKRFRSKWGGAGVLVSTDVNVSKTSFLSFYMEYLKKNGVKYEGVGREYELRSDKIRQEALAYAKQRVDTLQVVSTTAEQSTFFKEQGFVPELARAFFVPYGGFAASTKTRLFNDYKALAFGTTEQRKQAWKDIQATALEQSTFNVVSQGVKLAMYGAVGMLLRGMLDLDDKEPWEEWWARTKKQVAKDMLFSNLPVILGSPGEDMTVDFINEAYFNFLKLENPDLTEREYEKDHAPITRYKGYDDKWWDYLGPYGAPMAKLAEAFKFYEQIDNEDLSHEQKTLAFMAMMSQLGQLGGVLPSDLANAVRGEFNKQKRGSNAAIPKSTKSFNPSQLPQRPRNLPSRRLPPRRLPARTLH